jgi:hypothetical protein
MLAKFLFLERPLPLLVQVLVAGALHHSPLFTSKSNRSKARATEHTKISLKNRNISQNFTKISAYCADGGPGQKKRRQNFAKPI